MPQPTQYIKKSILVTGGAGFIGTHLCRALSYEGNSVLVLDLKKPQVLVPGVTYLEGDIRNPEQIQAALSKADAVFHLAALASMPYCQSYPLESYQTNVLGTANVLEAIRQENLKRSTPIQFVFTSSSAVYGKLGKPKKKLSEQLLLAAPLSFYAAQKLAAEHMILNYSRHHQIPAMVFRLFNIYGPGQDLSSPYAGVMTLYLSALQKRQPLKIDGTGKQTRDFIYVTDVANVMALTLKVSLTKWNAEPMNLGCGKSTSVLDLAKKMLAVSKIQVKLERRPSRQGDVSYSCADIRKLTQTLKWKPQVDLESGLSLLFKSS